MKKNFLFTLCAILCLCFLPLSGTQSVKRQTATKYTSTENYYTSLDRLSSSLSDFPFEYISHDFVFDNNVFPPKQIDHKEIIDGVPYERILKRYSFTSYGNKVVATYRFP